MVAPCFFKRALRNGTALLTACFLTSSLPAQAPPHLDLSDYQGTYRAEGGSTLEIVAGDDLFAVLDEAKYHLQPAATDQFTTASGQTITFTREPQGSVAGYMQNGNLYPRLSSRVTPASAALAYPRPPGHNSPGDYHYHPPADLHDGIPVGNIAASPLGLATANQVVQQILEGTYKDVDSVLLYHHGKLVLEEYFYGYTAARPHQLRSATKSVVSLLAGIAIDRGAIPGVSEPVLPHMKYMSYANPDPRKASMTLGNFLSMSSGLDCNDHSSTSPGRETVIDDQPDWVKATLDLPMIDPPGARGFYCSGGVAVVGRMTENAAHMQLPAFAQQHLFGPLGITRSDWVWNYNLTSADKEYSQIHPRPRDMLKLGILLSNYGRWGGRQIVSAAWVKASTANQSQVTKPAMDISGGGHGRTCQCPKARSASTSWPRRATAARKSTFLPQFDLVAVFTGGDYNSSGSPPNKIMTRIILPPLITAAAVAETQRPKP